MLPLFKKTILSLFLVAFVLPMVFGALVTPGVAQAQSATPTPAIECSIWDSVGSFVICGIGSLLIPIQQALGTLVSYLASGIVWAIDYGTKVMDLPAVTAGFQVTLSLVNLILVMALIIIAFQIILDYHSGSAKEKIPKIIIAAVLINFSLLIAGFLLDISNVFTLFFLKGVSSGAIYNTLDPNQFQTLGLSLSNGATGVTASIGIVVGQLFGILFTGIILIILIAVFATALVRILYVAVLLLLMPLTWGFWVFPGLSSHTGEWWSNFLKWGVTVMPTMTFFIYIALATTAKTRESVIGPVLGSKSETVFFDALLQILILGGLMIAGLKTANGAGGITSSAAIGAAGKVGGWVAKRKFAQSAAGRLSSTITNAAGSKIPVLQELGKLGVATGIAGAAANIAHGREHELEESAKARYGGMSKDQLISVAKTASLKSERAKIMIMLSKQPGGVKELGKQDPAALARLASAYEDQNGAHKSARDLAGVKDAIKENPNELAQSLGGTTSAGVAYSSMSKGEAAATYMMENGVASGLSASQITPEVVAMALKNQKLLASLDNNASATAVTKLKNTIDPTGSITVDLTAKYQLVKTARQAAEDAPKGTAAHAKAVTDRTAAINAFELASKSDAAKALRYLDSSIKSAP
jgi:hypothetical protein